MSTATFFSCNYARMNTITVDAILIFRVGISWIVCFVSTISFAMNVAVDVWFAKCNRIIVKRTIIQSNRHKFRSENINIMFWNKCQIIDCIMRSIDRSNSMPSFQSVNVFNLSNCTCYDTYANGKLQTVHISVHTLCATSILHNDTEPPPPASSTRLFRNVAGHSPEYVHTYICFTYMCDILYIPVNINSRPAAQTLICLHAASEWKILYTRRWKCRNIFAGVWCVVCGDLCVCTCTMHIYICMHIYARTSVQI